jgi:hypothetical protein
MKKSLIEIYALLVCFASIFFLLVNTATALYGGLRAVQPAITVDVYSIQRSTSDEAFMQGWPKERPAPAASEIPLLRKALYDQAVAAEQRGGLHLFISSFAFVIAAGLIFGVHWQLAQREHLEAPVSAAS